MSKCESILHGGLLYVPYSCSDMNDAFDGDWGSVTAYFFADGKSGVCFLQFIV